MTALQRLAKHYGLSLHFREGLWVISAAGSDQTTPMASGLPTAEDPGGDVFESSPRGGFGQPTADAFDDPFGLPKGTVIAPVELGEESGFSGGTALVAPDGTALIAPENLAPVQPRLRLAITADNEVIFGGKTIGLDGVAPMAKRLIERHQGKTEVAAVIQAHPKAKHGTVSAVFKALQEAGAKTDSISVLADDVGRPASRPSEPGIEGRQS